MADIKKKKLNGSPVDKELAILHIITVNGIGGAEKHLIDLLPALQQANNRIQCLILHRKIFTANAREIGQQVAAQGVAVFYEPYKNIFSSRTFSFIQNFIQEQAPHLVHTHLKHAELWLAYLKWRKRITVPVISTIHGYRDSYHNQYGLAWNPKQKSSPYYWFSSFIGKQLDGFISISNGITQFFTRSGLVDKKKIRTIHHGTSIQNQPVNTNKPVVPDMVMIGRLVKFKGHAYAIDAAALLKKTYPNLQLHFYGIGPEESALRKQVTENQLQDNVTFHGYVKNMPAVLANHSIALLPSIGEPFGLVFFDAFKAGLPVVAFDVAAVNEIITHGENGLLADPLDAESLAEQLSNLLQNPGLYRRIIKRADERMRTEFSMGKMAAAYSRYYQFIVQQ